MWFWPKHPTGWKYDKLGQHRFALADVIFSLFVLFSKGGGEWWKCSFGGHDMSFFCLFVPLSFFLLVAIKRPDSSFGGLDGSFGCLVSSFCLFSCGVYKPDGSFGGLKMSFSRPFGFLSGGRGDYSRPDKNFDRKHVNFDFFYHRILWFWPKKKNIYCLSIVIVQKLQSCRKIWKLWLTK